MTPITHEERILNGEDLQPINRKEAFIKRIYDKTQVVPEPITREEWFLNKAAEGSGDITIEQLNVSQNGTYSEQGKAYSPVIVNVPAPVLTTKNITANGTYSASADNADGYSSVEVAVAPPENSFVLTTKKDDVVDISDAADIPIVDLKADVSSADEVMVGVGDGENFIADNAPYLFRPTLNHTAEVKEMKEVLVGGSVAWNQIIEFNSNSFSEDINLASVATGLDNNFIFTKNGTLSDACGASKTLAKNHVYLISGQFKVGNSGRIGVDIRKDNYNYSLSSIKSTVTTVETTYQPFTLLGKTDDEYYMLGVRLTTAVPNGETGSVKNFQITDLTLMFGSTIADYVYTLEQSEAGSGIAWLKANGFFTKDYYAYNAGGIESVKTSAKKVIGFNQWDEQWENGILNSNGTIDVSPTRITTDYIHILPKTTYYIPDPCINGRYVYYDENKNVVGYNINSGFTTNIITTPNNAHYLRITLNFNYGSTYKNDICINLHWDGERDGEYEAYEEHTYSLDSDLELRGVPKLVDGKIKYDGDTYESDGTVTRRYGTITLNGTETWSENSASTNLYYTTISTLKNNGNFICEKYVSTTAAGTDMVAGQVKVAFRNLNFKTAYSTLDAWKAELAQNPIVVVYELLTPTTETADPYTNPQWVDNWGTEEFVDERDVPVPVGHESDYFNGDIYFSYIYDANGDKASATGTADLITGEVTGGNHCDAFVIKPTGDNVVAESGEVEVKYLVPLEEL